MKKLLTLVAILPAISLSGSCFGVDWIKDRIYISPSYSAGNFSYSIGYHYTNNVKISVQPIFFHPLELLQIYVIITSLQTRISLRMSMLV